MTSLVSTCTPTARTFHAKIFLILGMTCLLSCAISARLDLLSSNCFDIEIIGDFIIQNYRIINNGNIIAFDCGMNKFPNSLMLFPMMSRKLEDNAAASLQVCEG